MPTDLIPDVIIGLGYTDDITVSWAAWRVVSRYITDPTERAAKLLDRPPRDEDNPGVPLIRAGAASAPIKAKTKKSRP